MDNFEPSTNCGSDKPISEIEGELETLQRATNSIYENVKILNERLTPVLREVIPKENEEKEQIKGTLLGKSLATQSAKLFSMSDLINDITSRLGI